MNQQILLAKEIFEAKTGKKLDLKAVFFDMDGVLFDSMPNHVIAWKGAFSVYGIDMPAIDAYMNEGCTAIATAKKLYTKYTGKEISHEEAEKIKRSKHKRMENLPTSKVMPYMPQAVKLFTDNNIERWVVTGSAQNILIDRLEVEYNKMLSRNMMVSAFDVKIGKPNPEPYLMALQKSGMDKHQAIVVENAPLGVIAAKAAGLFTVGLNTGPLDIKVLADAGADILFQGSEEFFKAVPSIIDCLSSER